MEQKVLQSIFLKILAAELNGTRLDDKLTTVLTADSNNFGVLFNLSKKHDLAHIVASVLQKAGVGMPTEVESKFRKADFLSLYRFEQIKYAFAEICEVLEVAGIPYIPLKGAVIRPYYPDERMRTSCDIDILVHEKSLAIAVKALKSAGYTGAEHHHHDVSMYSSGGIHLELHFSLLRRIERMDSVLSRAWDYAVPVNGYQYEFTPGFFAFYHFAHMSAHFLHGGCGMRSVMDLHVMKHFMKIDFNEARVLLDEAELGQFAEEFLKFSEVCFADAQGDEFTDTLLDFILNGGAYGSMENQVVIQKQHNGGLFRYMLERMFPPYKTMKVSYLILQKAPFLLPFCWLVRAFTALFSHRSRRTIAELKTVKAVTADQMIIIGQLQERLHL